jgi:heptosyltransferase-3
LQEFFCQVADLDVLIGLDSLSVHVAHRLGRPSVMLIGTNDPAVWVPPSCIPVTSIARCGNQPCFNRPICQGTQFEFDCMKRISSNSVLDAILRCVASRRAYRNEATARD